MPSDIATVIRQGSGGRRSTSAAQALASAKKATKGVRVGRPSSYSPALCDRAVALGMKGQTWAGIARAFNISRNTLNEWEGMYPEFKDALGRARAAAQAHLEDHGRRNLKADRYQAQVWGKLISVHDDYKEVRAGNGIEIATDFLQAISEVADRRKLAQAQPGDGAKVVDVASSFEPSADPAKARE